MARPPSAYAGLSEAEVRHLAVIDRPADLAAGLEGPGGGAKRLVWVPHEQDGFAVAAVKEERGDEIIVQVGEPWRNGGTR